MLDFLYKVIDDVSLSSWCLLDADLAGVAEPFSKMLCSLPYGRLARVRITFVDHAMYAAC